MDHEVLAAVAQLLAPARAPALVQRAEVLAERSPAVGLEPLARSILKGAREMVRDIGMSEATFAEIKQHLSNEHMTDLVLTIAFYCAVVRVLATMKIDNEPTYKEVLKQYPIPGVN